MKNVLISIFLLLLLSLPCAHAGGIKVVADPWCPFTCEPNSDHPGIFIEILQEIFKKHHIEFSYDSVSWSRAVSDTRENTYQAIAGALKTDAPDFIFPESNFGLQKSCFFVTQKSHWRWKGVASLKKVNLGAVKDYTYGETLDDYISKKISPVDFITGTDTALRLLKKLLDNRNDVIVDDQNVVTYVLENHKEISSEHIINAGCIRAEPLYVAFGPKNTKSKEYAEIVTKEFKDMLKSKKINEIYKRYGLKFSQN